MNTDCKSAYNLKIISETHALYIQEDTLIAHKTRIYRTFISIIQLKYNDLVICIVSTTFFLGCITFGPKHKHMSLKLLYYCTLRKGTSNSCQKLSFRILAQTTFVAMRIRALVETWRNSGRNGVITYHSKPKC